MNEIIGLIGASFTDLTIQKAYRDGADYSIDENQTFVFEISGKPYNTAAEFETMTVLVKGDGEIKLKDLPVGDYTVKEITDWSWRYTPDKTSETITLSARDKDDYKVTFTNTRTESKWLSGDCFAKNWWGNNTSTRSR